MRLDFLGAADGTPLTKTFSEENGVIKTAPYPLIRELNSFSEIVNSIDDAYNVLVKHASNNNCLLKGMLTAELNKESRAGKTNAAEPTSYILLDNDFEDGFDSIDDYLTSLHPGFENVSYIVHHSSSAGIRYKKGLRSHILIMLAKPEVPSILKQWLMHKNLTLPQLSDRFELSANAMALKWPLDISTCQNDKLIYIADPICNGVEDTIKGERFELVKKDSDFAHIDFNSTNPAVIQELTENKVNELRQKIGLKKRVAKYGTYNGEQILKNPNKAIVTDVRNQRGFVYLNLNGGNSWAYYYPEDNPEVLYNFKGEPLVRLKDAVPDYYATLFTSSNGDEAEIEPVVFRDRESDTYYNGIFSRTQNVLDIHPVSSTQKIADFLQQFGRSKPDFIEDWELVFDPRTNTVVDFKNKWANTFSPSEYLQGSSIKCLAIPRTINKIINSVVGNDEEAAKHFINWLASIFQTREKTTTAWLFHGVPGTGKGVLFEKILKPLFGRKYVNEFTTASFEDNFNKQVEHSIIMWLDEFNISDGMNATKIMNKLKNLITEHEVVIRGMRKDGVSRRVFNNIILATNHVDPIIIEPNDRRWNIPPSQNNPITLESYEIDMLDEELPLFAAYLQDFKVNKKQVKKILLNEERQRMIRASQTSVEAFFEAIRTGNIDFFIQFLRDKNPLLPDQSYTEYQRAVKRWASNIGTEIIITRDEIMNTYSYLQNLKQGVSSTKFSRQCTMNRLDVKPQKLNGKSVRGIRILFTGGNQDEIEQITQPDVVGLDGNKISNA